MPEETQVNEEPKKRIPQEKMGETEKAQLVAICMRSDCRTANGGIDVTAVANLTGYSRTKVQSFLSRYPYLNAQQDEANASKLMPTNSEFVDSKMKPADTPDFTRDQWNDYQALLRQQRKMLAKDWEKLGIDEEDAGRMEHYCTLGTAPVGGIMRLLGGQLLTNVNLLDRVLKSDAEKILKEMLPPEKDKEGEPRAEGDVQRDWQYLLFSGMKLQLEMTSHVHKIQAVMARVAADLQKLNGGNKPEDKGQFDSR